MLLRSAWLSLLLASVAGSVAAQESGDITIYRCTDDKGRLSLQDSPCAKAQSQQTRQMLQLKDSPPRPPSVPPPAAPATPATVQPQVVVIRTPQPMYECVRPDNSIYISDNDDGNPRWQSAWSMLDDMPRGYAPGIQYNRIAPHSSSAPRATGSTNAGNGAPALRFVGRDPPPAPPSEPPPRPYPPHPGHDHVGPGFGGGAWIRDACHPLPQREVCARLRDRREDIRRRRFNAQEIERATLATEERGISARLSADCGGS